MLPDGLALARSLWTHQKGGLYHDGRFATLKDVLEQYNRQFKLGLNEQEKGELILTHLPGIALAVIRTPTENRWS